MVKRIILHILLVCLRWLFDFMIVVSNECLHLIFYLFCQSYFLWHVKTVRTHQFSVWRIYNNYTLWPICFYNHHSQLLVWRIYNNYTDKSSQQRGMWQLGYAWICIIFGNWCKSYTRIWFEQNVFIIIAFRVSQEPGQKYKTAEKDANRGFSPFVFIIYSPLRL